ncbi:MAG TPA: hypothetical protein VE088_01870 [Gaiellaceae bacterium]|nr:hypothetical protein [Gaiellaceae bacterium]
MAPDTVWELVFLMVILKIPIAYLCTVVWYAIKAKPRRGGTDTVAVRAEPDPPAGGSTFLASRRRPRPSRPHGAPARAYPRSARVAVARSDRIGGR